MGYRPLPDKLDHWSTITLFSDGRYNRRRRKSCYHRLIITVGSPPLITAAVFFSLFSLSQKKDEHQSPKREKNIWENAAHIKIAPKVPRPSSFCKSIIMYNKFVPLFFPSLWSSSRSSVLRSRAERQRERGSERRKEMDGEIEFLAVVILLLLFLPIWVLDQEQSRRRPPERKEEEEEEVAGNPWMDVQ